MDKKTVIGLALLCSVCTTGWINNAAAENPYPELTEPAGKISGTATAAESHKLPDGKAEISVPDSARTAAADYEAAMSSANASDRDKYLAEAISSIAEAATEQPENPDVLLLASQIYRAKGGLSYAKSYYRRACNLYKAEADSRPHDAAAQLAMAIACYAGDARYEGSYEISKGLAESYAQEVLAEKFAPEKISEQKTSKDEFVPSALQEAQKDKFVPSVKLEDKKNETLPAKHSAKDVEKFLAALILQDGDLQEQIYGAMDKDAFTAREEQIMKLYEKVKEGSWLWNVSSRQSAEQELLLKYLRLWQRGDDEMKS